ncbi:MAG: ABC transporter ATP-binding protein [Pseudomonadota bacterium]
MTLAVDSLRIAYAGSAVVDGVSFSLPPGKCLGVVGESGSGKSQMGLALMGLLPATAETDGTVHIHGEALPDVARRDQLAMVFQDPQSAFCPHMRIADQVFEAMGGRDATAAAAFLKQAGLSNPEQVLAAYPHALSGGMRQRAMLAMALARTPSVIVADEPTTALDAEVQLALLKEFAAVKAIGVSLILISHDMGVIAGLADDILVMQNGRAVEQGAAEAVLQEPQHPYTRDLIAAATLKQAVPAQTQAGPVLIEGRGLTKCFPMPKAHPFARSQVKQALIDAAIEVRAGETLAIVGESGSGKSTLASLMLGLAPPSEGEVLWKGENFIVLPPGRQRPLRRYVQPVFQDPFASFDPQRTLGRSIQDMIDLHGTNHSVEALLASVNLPPDIAERYPHQASGGQNQRAALARALAADPEVLVCDEALSALDKTTQAQILALLQRIKEERGLAMLFISHDLDVVAAIADRIAVLKDGHMVETGPVQQIMQSPQSPYTQRLLAAQTVPDAAVMRAKITGS